MDSNFQFRDAPADSAGALIRRREGSSSGRKRSIGFAEVDDCSDDTAAPTVDRPVVSLERFSEGKDILASAQRFLQGASYLVTSIERLDLRTQPTASCVAITDENDQPGRSEIIRIFNRIKELTDVYGRLTRTCGLERHGTGDTVDAVAQHVAKSVWWFRTILIIPLLIPLALRGVRFLPASAEAK